MLETLVMYVNRATSLSVHINRPSWFYTGFKGKNNCTIDQIVCTLI